MLSLMKLCRFDRVLEKVFMKDEVWLRLAIGMRNFGRCLNS